MAEETDENPRGSETNLIKSNNSTEDRAFKIKAGIFLTSVAGLAMFSGFGYTLATAKKKDPESFNRGLFPANLKQPHLTEAGYSLALRALGWGTLYAFAGCGILFYAAWKVLGVSDLQQFRQKMGQILPQIPKNEPPQGRTEFESLTDLLQYVIDEDESKKKNKGRTE